MKVIRIASFLLAGSISTAHAQILKERLLFTDKDSACIKAQWPYSIDKDGNYSFRIKVDSFDVFQTPNGRSKRYPAFESSMGSDQNIEYTNTRYAPQNTPWHYKNPYGHTVYGPVTGLLRSKLSYDTKENIAIITTTKDSIKYYIDGKLVYSKLNKASEEAEDETKKWCVFSPDGRHKIYYLKKGKSYYLYIDSKLADSSRSEYYEMQINNAGKYTYGEGKRPNDADDCFHIHTPDTVLGPVRTLWDHAIRTDGSYYYCGDNNGKYYMAINNKVFTNINKPDVIMLANNGRYLFAGASDEENVVINANGKQYNTGYRDILCPSIDDGGNFAWYGIKDYYLYKFVKGQQVAKPITRYGVRPHPIYISPKGVSLHYFETEDSIYIYRDDSLLFPAISTNRKFLVEQCDDYLNNQYSKELKHTSNSLLHMQIDSTSYLVYNGTISKPTIEIKHREYGDNGSKGEIVAGELTDNGFYVIQRTAPNTYLINVNNNIYKEINGTWRIVSDNFYFEDSSLTFYGIRGLSFYQFILEL